MKKTLLFGLYLIMAAAAALTSSVGTAAQAVELDGLIEPYLIVKVGSSVAGVIDEVEVDRGDLVKKGQRLAKLQDKVERATVELSRARAPMKSTIAARQARLDYTQRKQQRMEELYKKKVIPFEEMDKSRTDNKLAEMQLAEEVENLGLAELEYKRSVEVVERMTIRSPITGVVMERFLSPGEYVEDQPILKLAQIDPLNVEVFAPVEMFGTVKVGMQAKVRPEKPIGGSYDAKVVIVDRVIDAASGTFGIRLEIPNSKYHLPAGLKCRVIFQSAR
jgi:RND family efflux transporter MFP subunit